MLVLPTSKDYYEKSYIKKSGKKKLSIINVLEYYCAKRNKGLKNVERVI